MGRCWLPSGRKQSKLTRKRQSLRAGHDPSQGPQHNLPTRPGPLPPVQSRKVFRPIWKCFQNKKELEGDDSPRLIACGGDAAPVVSVSDVCFIPKPVITSGQVASSPQSTDQGPQVPGASSNLERSEDQITMSLQTSDLEPGIYTVGWVIYPPNQINGQMALATGGEVGQDGVGNFEGTLEKGDLDLVQNLLNAKVELIVRYLGPPIEGSIEEQKTDMDGGCDIDPNPCENVQIAVHSGPE